MNLKKRRRAERNINAQTYGDIALHLHKGGAKIISEGWDRACVKLCVGGRHYNFEKAMGPRRRTETWTLPCCCKRKEES